MSYYLAYGMNTNKREMSQRCPQAKSLGRVTLKGHKLAFKQFCDAVVDPKSSMDCVLWDITPECERALDILEGFPNFYLKKNVDVMFGGRRVTAMIYYMTGHYKQAFPSEYYLSTVINGYVEHDVEVDQIEEAFDAVQVEIAQ